MAVGSRKFIYYYSLAQGGSNHTHPYMKFRPCKATPLPIKKYQHEYFRVKHHKKLHHEITNYLRDFNI